MRKMGLLSICVLLVVPALTQTSPPKIQLLETGSFHGDEVKAHTGEKWLGLYVTKNNSSLVSSTLRIKRVVDAITDLDTPGQKTGKDVSVDQPAKPIFLVKNAAMLKEGPVMTVYRGSTTKRHELMSMEDWKSGKMMRLRLGEQEYQLKIVGRKRQLTGESQGQMAFDVKLILTDGKTTQALYSIKDNVESRPWHLLWAGDADGDGKLDLYLDLSWHYNASESKLFLSSRAKSGQLVKDVARFYTVGC